MSWGTRTETATATGGLSRESHRLRRRRTFAFACLGVVIAGGPGAMLVLKLGGVRCGIPFVPNDQLPFPCKASVEVPHI